MGAAGSGRKPKPLERRLALEAGDGQGASHHAETQEIIEYQTSGTEVEKPEGLKERGSLEWDRIWEAGKVWLHPTEDYPWVEQICYAYDDVDAFRRRIRRDGLMCTGYNGQVVANPLIKEVRAAEATIRKCLSQIGFSPTDRARLGLAEIKAQSGLADLQNKTRNNSSR